MILSNFTVPGPEPGPARQSELEISVNAPTSPGTSLNSLFGCFSADKDHEERALREHFNTKFRQKYRIRRPFPEETSVTSTVDVLRKFVRDIKKAPAWNGSVRLRKYCHSIQVVKSFFTDQKQKRELMINDVLDFWNTEEEQRRECMRKMKKNVKKRAHEYAHRFVPEEMRRSVVSAMYFNAKKTFHHALRRQHKAVAKKRSLVQKCEEEYKQLRDSGFDGTSQRGADLLAQLEVLQKLVAAQQSQMPTFEFSRNTISLDSIVEFTVSFGFMPDDPDPTNTVENADAASKGRNKPCSSQRSQLSDEGRRVDSPFSRGQSEDMDLLTHQFDLQLQLHVVGPDHTLGCTSAHSCGSPRKRNPSACSSSSSSSHRNVLRTISTNDANANLFKRCSARTCSALVWDADLLQKSCGLGSPRALGSPRSPSSPRGVKSHTVASAPVQYLSPSSPRSASSNCAGRCSTDSSHIPHMPPIVKPLESFANGGSPSGSCFSPPKTCAAKPVCGGQMQFPSLTVPH
jgi:hypothetical protein